MLTTACNVSLKNETVKDGFNKYLSPELFLFFSLCLSLRLLELELLSSSLLQVQPLTESVFNRHLNEDRQNISNSILVRVSMLSFSPSVVLLPILSLFLFSDCFRQQVEIITS